MSKSQTTIQRVMPQPWFRAQASARCIAEITRGEAYRSPSGGERQLGPFILPAFQRPSVWTTAQQIKLLESVWDGLPIGAYVFNLTAFGNPCDGWLLDGQQRVTALLAYVSGEFPVYGWRFHDLPRPEQRGFMMSPFAALQTQISDEAQCREVYDRLAYGGTAHAPKDVQNV